MHEEDPEAEIGYLCLECFSRLRRQLTELPAIAAWLHANIAAGGSGLHDKVTGSSDDPIPLRPDVLDLIGPVAPNPTAAFTRDDEDHLTWEALDQSGEPGLLDETRSWAVLVEEETGDEWEDRQTLTGAVAYLAAHLSWIAGQAWVDEFAGKIRELGQRAHKIAPWRTELIRANEACEDCGVQAVVIHLGEGFRRCEPRGGGCGRRKKLSEYEYRVILPEHRSAG